MRRDLSLKRHLGTRIDYQRPVDVGARIYRLYREAKRGPAVDVVRKRFGGNAVDYGAASRVGRSVPDEFRRLAEREL